MSNYDRRLQRLEDKHIEPSESFCLVFPMKGETDEAAILRMGIDPTARCVVIKFVSSKDGRPIESA
jgi:hypothetical protein